MHEPLQAAEQAANFLEYFRENEGLVVHVRHNHEPGGSIHKTAKPLKNEKIISKNKVN